MRAVVLLFLLFQVSSAYKILVLFPHPGRSHFDVFLPLFKALSEKGHHVTVVGHFPQANQTEYYRDVSLKGTTQHLLNAIPFSELTGSRNEKYFGVMFLNYLAKFSCLAGLKSTQMHELLESEEKYDVILTEMFNTHCFSALIEKFKAPFIGMASHVLMPWSNDWFANPDNPSYIPVIFLDYSDNMSFLQRVENTVMLVFNKIFYAYVTTVQSTQFSEKHLGVSISSDIMYNASAVLVNSHFSLNRPRPVVPGVIEIGGIHVGEVKPLPKVRTKMVRHQVTDKIANHSSSNGLYVVCVTSSSDSANHTDVQICRIIVYTCRLLYV